MISDDECIKLSLKIYNEQKKTQLFRLRYPGFKGMVDRNIGIQIKVIYFLRKRNITFDQNDVDKITTLVLDWYLRSEKEKSVNSGYI